MNTRLIPHGIPRGKHHNKSKTKTTVSLYLSKKLVEKAKKQGLNLSQIMENTLKSILDYLECSNKPTNLNSTSFNGGMGELPPWAGSSAWNERLTCNQEVAGSNPARSTNYYVSRILSCSCV